MNKFLIVVDMQNDFIDGSLGSKEAIAIVPNVCEKIKNFPGTIIFTRDTHPENYLELQEGKNLPVEHCIEGTHGWILNADMINAYKETHSDITIIDKPTFGSVNLAKLLSDKILNKVSAGTATFDQFEIELVGLCTDICVISNALLLKAFLPEVKISVDATCCAGVTPETHQAALATMKCCQINIIE